MFIACQNNQSTSVSYTQAELTPPFEHGNAAWAGVALLDYDNDGWLDIFFTNGQSQQSALYKNNKDGNFVDVASSAGIISMLPYGAVSSGDLDNDGDADLAVTVECTLGTLNEDGQALSDGGLHLYWNNGDGTFSHLF